MARLFASALAEGIRPLGLAPAQFLVLIELWQQAGLTQRQLVERLDVEQATMANTLNRMERDGLIVRRPHPDDKRAQVISPTQKATELEAPAKACAMNVNARAMAGLDDEERQTFIALANRIIEGLQDRQKDQR
jgi:DNA-binding MarR family transcriptional regulator